MSKALSTTQGGNNNSRTVSESQNSYSKDDGFAEVEVDVNGDTNVLVEHDQLQMQSNSSRPSSLEIRNHTRVTNNGLTPTQSSTDLPNTVGNTARRDNGELLYEEIHHQRRFSEEVQNSHQRIQQWDSNYKEAAIFLDEGQNNDKFTHHPRSYDHLPAYLMVHNKWFNLIDLFAAVVLLSLAFAEGVVENVIVHASVELCALILIAVQVALKTRWIGWKTFMLHKRTAIKVLTLFIMTIEALVVIANMSNHFRITRCLRPIFLIDNHFCGGVRRFIRQILQSMPPIMDMLALVFFVMMIYSVFGFYFFGEIDKDNFQTLSKSFVSLFVLLTTANNPDVMMKSYNTSRWAAVFFISYLAINLYFLMNLMLAVVYDAFTKIEKDKFRRLFLHKRKAAQHAFKLLVTQERPEQVSFQHLEGLLTAYRPTTTPTEAYLIFKLINKSESGYLSLDEFYEIYDACQYAWSIGRPPTEWYHDMKPSIRRCLSFLHKAVSSTWFEYTICFAVLTNGVVLLVQTSLMESPIDNESSIYVPWVSYFFVTLYTVEASIKLLGMGSVQYFSSYWNTFDFGVTLLGILALIFEFIGIPLSYIIILRPLSPKGKEFWRNLPINVFNGLYKVASYSICFCLRREIPQARLLTLFRMKRRFRDVFGTAVILMPRLLSAVIVLLLIYYFFAIIGMECFGPMDLKNCCINTTVEQYYKYENGSDSNAYYYLNNFHTLAESYVVLFELTVVNNWYVIMDGYAFYTREHNYSTHEWTRAYFMIFYIFTMIVMTIIVAFILEAFLFRIQFTEFLNKQEEIKKMTAEINLNADEIRMLVQRSGSPDHQTSNISNQSNYKFIGNKRRTKEQLQSLMYFEEMDTWLAQEKLAEAHTQARLMAALISHDASEERPNLEQNGVMASSGNPGGRLNYGENVLVVEDEDDEVTTIRRPTLPDLMA